MLQAFGVISCSCAPHSFVNCHTVHKWCDIITQLRSIISLSTQFKNWSIVWSPHFQHKLKQRLIWRDCDLDVITLPILSGGAQRPLDFFLFLIWQSCFLLFSHSAHLFILVLYLLEFLTSPNILLFLPYSAPSTNSSLANCSLKRLAKRPICFLIFTSPVPSWLEEI